MKDFKVFLKSRWFLRSIAAAIYFCIIISNIMQDEWARAVLWAYILALWLVLFSYMDALYQEKKSHIETLMKYRNTLAEIAAEADRLLEEAEAKEKELKARVAEEKKACSK